METGLPLTSPLMIGILAAAALLLIVVIVAWYRWSHSTPVQVRRALAAISHDRLDDVYFADGMGGYIHIDALLLTNRGILVLDIKDIEGTLFGADKMDEWVVMNGKHRHGFRNPLGALHDRIASLRVHAKTVHVEGYVVFTDHGRFTKGMPDETIMLSELVATVGPSGDDYPQAFADTWNHLKEIAEQDHTLPPHA